MSRHPRSLWDTADGTTPCRRCGRPATRQMLRCVHCAEFYPTYGRTAAVIGRAALVALPLAVAVLMALYLTTP